MSQAKTQQKLANERAFEDGVRCRKKGLGITKSGKYDHETWSHYFKVGFRKQARSVDEGEAFDEWVEGWHREDERLAHRAQGHYPCGRPI